eukprot:g44880.t1
MPWEHVFIKTSARHAARQTDTRHEPDAPTDVDKAESFNHTDRRSNEEVNKQRQRGRGELTGATDRVSYCFCTIQPEF